MYTFSILFLNVVKTHSLDIVCSPRYIITSFFCSLFPLLTHTCHLILYQSNKQSKSTVRYDDSFSYPSSSCTWWFEVNNLSVGPRWWGTQRGWWIICWVYDNLVDKLLNEDVELFNKVGVDGYSTSASPSVWYENSTIENTMIKPIMVLAVIASLL